MSGNNAAQRQQRQAEADERARLARIRRGRAQIDEVFSEFDDEFYDRLRTAQQGVLLPDIDRQFNNGREQLIFALSRAGQLNSQTAATRDAELAEERVRALSDADSIANQTVKNARSAVEQERGIINNQLTATADPELAANTAANAANVLRVQEPIRTIGPLFQNATAGLAAAFAPRYDAYGNRVSRSGGLFSSAGTDRSRVVGGG